MFNVLQNKIIYFFGAVVLILSFVAVPLFANADFNQQINYQGKLTDSSGMAVADGDYNMYFWLIASSTAASSTSVWSEVRTGVDKVQVTNGLFSVMLGEVSSLSGVDFNQTLYLGVEIGGTSVTPAWDGEMSPRKILGAVPAAFEAKNAETLDNLATTSFLRADEVDTMQASSSSALLTLIQNGAGKLFSVFSGVTEMFTISNSGNIGLGTTTPSHKLTVIGNTYLNGSLNLTGALNDSLNASGTSGQILSSTGTSTQWTSTSALGLGNGTFLGLTDTPSSYTASRIIFTNSGATALTDSADLTYDGTNLSLGANKGIAFGGTRYLYASNTNYSVIFGENAGATFTNDTIGNVAIGYGAGQYASTSASDNSNFIGIYAGLYNTGSDNNIFGNNTGYNNTGSYNNLFGGTAGRNNTGSYNNMSGQGVGYNNTGSHNNMSGYLAGHSNTGSYNNIFGYQAGVNNTGSYNNLLGRDVGYKNTGRYNEMFGYEAGYNLQSTSSIIIGTQAFRGGSGSTAFQAINNVAIGYRAGYNATTSADNNILLGYQVADNLTSGANNIVIGYDVDIASTTGSNQLNIGNLIFGTGIDGTGTSISSGNIGVGTTTPSSKLTISGDVNVDSSYGYKIGGNTVLYASSTNTGTFVGIGAGRLIGSTGVNNVAVGYRSLYNATSSVNNTAVGFHSMYLNTSGNNNTALGYHSMYSNTTGSNNMSIGRSSLYANTTGANNIAVGYQSLGANITGSSNVAIGFQALLNATSSTANVGIGTASLSANTGSYNTAIGYGSLQSNTTAQYNTAIGYRALYLNTSGGDNTALGYQSMYSNTTGSNNMSIGRSSLYANTTGANNTAVGYQSLGTNITGSSNVAIGFQALLNATSSTANVGIGTQVGYGTAGYRNQGGVAIGFQAGYSFATSSDYNTLLGYRSGYGVTTGSRNILLGQSTIASSYNQVTTGSNNIAIGNDVAIASSTSSNQLNIGNLIYGTNLDGTGSSLSSGNIGIGTSTPLSRLALEKTTFSGNGVAGIHQYIKSTNSTASAVQYGDFSYIYASNTATTTIAGGMLKIEDRTGFGNTIRGFEVQTERGTNTLGENTALSGFARTFGVRGTTEGDAGGTYEPAGVFAETRGTSQGNAIRGYSSSITTTSLLKLFQDTSTFVGSGLLMNFGNSGGSFSSTTASKFIDLQNAGTSMFTVGAYGKLTIGDGTTNNNAGIQVGYGGICVDNDGTCTASTTGRVSAVSYHTGNSDLAEMYFSNESLKTGEIVYIKNGLSVGRADESNEGKIIGVVSTKPGQLLGFDDVSLRKGEQGYPVALKGRVPVRLSNENGEIKAGDELMLSSVPGVAMKASSTGKVVGVALENYDGLRAYSDTYINQFGDDLVDPVFEPINKDNDPRIDDGCYYGGGNASGDRPCIPLKSISKDDQIKEVETLAKREAEERELAKLAKIESETKVLANGKVVKIGQIVMFVDLRNRDLSEVGAEMVLALTANTDSDNEEENTIWKRLVNLANNFVDGVLSVFTLKADRVEINNQLCVDGVCVTGEELRQMLNKNNQNNESTVNTQNDIPTEDNQNNESENNTNNEQANEELSVTQEEILDTNNTSVEANQDEEEVVDPSENNTSSVVDEEEESVVEEGLVEAESVNDSSGGESDETSI